jgi:hypothetical protein
VFRQGRFLPPGGVLMTGVAQVFHRVLQEGILPGSVRIVAVPAGGLVHEGPMETISVEGLVHHARVASPAQFKTLPFGLERIRGGRFQMALVAHLFRYRRMDVSP